ncbi:MAG: AmmeMemoRadiSam system protein B [Candidatus Cloacimonetes bacterium]|nr:AmmeMemoRadiSam system protein B [Candidatus Cloacimonadota bacterium]
MDNVMIFSLFLVFCLLLPLECKIRKPAVSGRWYPSNPVELRKEIDDYLNQVELTDEQKQLQPLGILVPHAGYMFSAPVAAWCYKLLEGKKYDTVILIGSSHHFLQGIVSVYDGDSMSTPLGLIQVDNDLVTFLKNYDKSIDSMDKIHSVEHSNEAQMPFLQVMLPEFKAVSILTSCSNPEVLKKTADALYDYVSKSDKKFLFVISSDMSHYHPYEKANKMDAATLKLIEEEKWEELHNKIKNRECELCGSLALDIFSDIYRRLGGGNPVILHYANSGDAHPEYGLNEVVGYGAIVFPLEKEEVKTSELTDTDKSFLLYLALTTIDDALKGRKTQISVPDSPILNEHRAVFVTLHKHGELRGCIGHMEARTSLYKAVREMAASAAFQDPRFSPVTEKEMADIEIEISVLTPMQRINSVADIVMGRDGVMVKSGWHSGVFLPQVARETGWNKETFLRHLCSGKANLPADAWKDPETEIYIFQVEEFSE